MKNKREDYRVYFSDYAKLTQKDAFAMQADITKPQSTFGMLYRADKLCVKVEEYMLHDKSERFTNAIDETLDTPESKYIWSHKYIQLYASIDFTDVREFDEYEKIYDASHPEWRNTLDQLIGICKEVYSSGVEPTSDQLNRTERLFREDPYGFCCCVEHIFEYESMLSGWLNSIEDYMSEMTEDERNLLDVNQNTYDSLRRYNEFYDGMFVYMMAADQYMVELVKMKEWVL